MTRIRRDPTSRNAKRGRRPPTLDRPAETVVTSPTSGEAPPPPDGDLPVARVAGKPPYRVPRMAEIAAVPWNGLRVVSTFSGCGGSCLGFRMAGYRVVWASEFVQAARETYVANHPTPHVDPRDIRTVTAEDILRVTGLARGELDVFEGSPPCASFSTAGKREKLWGVEKKYSDVQQRTDDLFREWLRLLGGLMPRSFVAENVSGMVIGTAKGHFLEVVKEMRQLGYRVGARLLDAQWLGVPQARRRVIFVGIREDLGLEPPFPAPLPYRYSIRDALPWLAGQPVIHDTSGQFGAGDVTDRPCPTITVGMDSINETVGVDGPAPAVMADGLGGACARQVKLHDAPPPPTAEELAAVDFSRYAIGEEWQRLKPGHHSDRYLNLKRTHPDRPSPTVTTTAGRLDAASVAHPTAPRKFTISELRRICGFPDDFVLTGTHAQQCERLGRSVPPPMMYAVARELAAALGRAR